jgi:hypothetical protein
LVNSRPGCFAAASLLRRPLSRSYGALLPSSLTRVRSNALVSSTHLPVSDCGTGVHKLCLEVFRGPGQPYFASPVTVPLEIGRDYAGGFSYPATRFLFHNNQRCGKSLPKRHPIAPMHGAGISTCRPSSTTSVLDLGPPNLRLTNMAGEALGFRRTGFSPVFSLLMPAFSLLCAPPVLPLELHCT